jgi:hypothetical protein
VLGCHTTLVLEAVEKSLAEGERLKTGATLGTFIDLGKLLASELGTVAAKDYGFA